MFNVLQSGESGESGLILGEMKMGDCGKLGECCVGSAERFDPMGVGVLEGGAGE